MLIIVTKKIGACSHFKWYKGDGKYKIQLKEKGNYRLYYSVFVEFYIIKYKSMFVNIVCKSIVHEYFPNLIGKDFDYKVFKLKGKKYEKISVLATWS